MREKSEPELLGGSFRLFDLVVDMNFVLSTEYGIMADFLLGIALAAVAGFSQLYSP